MEEEISALAVDETRRSIIGEASGQSRRQVGRSSETAGGENGVAAAALVRRRPTPLNHGA
eukprot:4328394-Pleurochrysis_carterae.AAC.1